MSENTKLRAEDTDKRNEEYNILRSRELGYQPIGSERLGERIALEGDAPKLFPLKI